MFRDVSQIQNMGGLGVCAYERAIRNNTFCDGLNFAPAGPTVSIHT